MNLEIVQVMSSLMTAVGILLAVFVGYQILRRFLIGREREKMHEFDLRRMEIEKSGEKSQDPQTDTTTVDPSGYIIINLPDSQKSLFIDLLKGFEEYAILKGYRISFSYDGSLPNKVAFRFTIIEGGITVSTEKVRQDMQDYIRKVQNGDSFDDLDIIVPPEQHHITTMVLKNRLAFLQNTYATQRNALQLYERLIKTFGSGSLQSPSLQFFVQGGGTMSPTQYSAINSQQIAQGDHIRMIGNTASQTLNIGSTFNERKVIADMFEHVRQLLWKEKGETLSKAMEAGKLLEKAKDEICDELQPDESRLKRYIGKAREIFATMTFAQEAVDAFKELLETIGLT